MDQQKADYEFVIFRLMDKEYAIGIDKVLSVEKLSSVTRVPSAPEYVKGLINVRGEVITVVDLKERFLLTDVCEGNEQKVIILDIEGNSLGILVDDVEEIAYINNDLIENVDRILPLDAQLYIIGVAKIDERIITILDIDRLFNTRLH